MKQEKRLKNLYIRIHNGYALTLNDLVFLAEHDMECCVKTCERIVNGEPEKKIFDKKIEITEVPVARDDKDRKSIDVIISQMRNNRVGSDVFVGLKAIHVMNLIQEQPAQESAQSRQYTYYSSVEPSRILNAQV